MEREPQGTDQPVTALLARWRAGDAKAMEALIPLVYDELRVLARHYLRREQPNHTLQSTALVHEAYVRLVDQSLPDFANRKHFFGVVAHLMRQVLVDFARAHRSEKRGAGLKAPLEEGAAVAVQPAVDILALDEALDRLAAFDTRKASVIELRYFGGLSREEVADALDLTLATVKRDLSLGEAWLRRELTN